MLLIAMIYLPLCQLKEFFPCSLFLSTSISVIFFGGFHSLDFFFFSIGHWKYPNPATHFHDHRLSLFITRNFHFKFLVSSIPFTNYNPCLFSSIIFYFNSNVLAPLGYPNHWSHRSCTVHEVLTPPHAPV